MASARIPPLAFTRWFSRSSSRIRETDSTAPALGSAAPVDNDTADGHFIVVEGGLGQPQGLGHPSVIALVVHGAADSGHFFSGLAAGTGLTRS